MNRYDLEHQIRQILEGRQLMPKDRGEALLKLCLECYEEGWNDAMEAKEMIEEPERNE